MNSIRNMKNTDEPLLFETNMFNLQHRLIVEKLVNFFKTVQTLMK